MFTNLRNIWIDAPHFPGFYNSVYDTNLDNWEDDFEAVFGGKVNENTYNALKDEMENNRWDYFNNDEYMKAVGKNYAECLENVLNDIDGMPKLKVKFIRIDSPRFYNFETDKCVCKISGINKKSLKKIIKLAKKWESELRTKIKEDWSNRDGFWNFIDNDYDHWIKVLELDEEALAEYADADDYNSGKLHPMIGILLGYIIELEKPDFEYDLIFEALEEIYDVDFINYDACLAKFNLSWQDVDDNSKQLDLVDYLNNMEKENV